MWRHVPELTTINTIHRAKQTNEWKVAPGKLPLLFSPALSAHSWMRHAFTTRHGGTSSAPLDSFNLARHWHTEESKIDALENRKVLCEALGLDHGRLAVPSQQHTSNVSWITDQNATTINLDGVDALCTATPGQSLLLHFADCVPVIMADTRTRTIAVIHAGWRGTAAGIVSKAVGVMVDRGCAAQDIVVAVGPAIRDCCFETGPEVAEELARSVDSGSELISWKENRPYPDLQAMNALQAYQAGVQQVDVSAWCTACHPELFYSHRQSRGQTGRQGAIAGLVMSNNDHCQTCDK